MHLCGSRYTDRAEDVTEIKVYSNQKKVSLFVDGAEKETKEGARIFRFRVPITGTHTIRVVSGDCTDEITVRKVDTPNPDYIFNKQGDVVNWFDKEDFKADHYSISDTLGELAKNEMANAIGAEPDGTGFRKPRRCGGEREGQPGIAADDAAHDTGKSLKAGGRRCERGADESVKRRIAENSKELGNTK